MTGAQKKKIRRIIRLDLDILFYDQEIIDMLIDNGVMKDMNKIFVALK